LTNPQESVTFIFADILLPVVLISLFRNKEGGYQMQRSFGQLKIYQKERNEA